MQALLLTVCLEQLSRGSCPGNVLELFECRAEALRASGADPLKQPAHYADGVSLQQVCCLIGILMLLLFKRHAKF